MINMGKGLEPAVLKIMVRVDLSLSSEVIEVRELESSMQSPEVGACAIGIGEPGREENI